MADLLRTVFRLLFFRITREELLLLSYKHLAFGVLCTWLVGMGRYWDHPNAKLAQYLGIGSIVYIFVLSAFLWIFIKPLKPKDWSYFNLLTFISLVSPPAALYAIPVEKWFSLETATSLNVWFLAIVAGWRVALLIFYLNRYGELDFGAVFVGTFLPLIVIVVTLTVLNLEGVVFKVMAGIDHSQRSANDAAFGVLVLLTLLSQLLVLPLLIAYIVMIVSRWKSR